MKVKYKLRDKSTGTSYVDISSYNLDKHSNVISVVVDGSEVVITKDHRFYKFMEKVGDKDGVDVYHGDKALADIANIWDNKDEDGELVYTTRTLIGEFRELWEEGLYYFCTEDDEEIAYIADKSKVIKFL